MTVATGGRELTRIHRKHRVYRRQTAELLGSAHEEGRAWGDMDIICRLYSEMDECSGVLRQRGLPHQVRKGAGSFDPAADTIKVLTLHAWKELEFPVEALLGAGHMPAPGEDESEVAKLFCVGATRDTQRLVVGASGCGKFAARIGKGRTLLPVVKPHLVLLLSIVHGQRKSRLKVIFDLFTKVVETIDEKQ